MRNTIFRMGRKYAKWIYGNLLPPIAKAPLISLVTWLRYLGSAPPLTSEELSSLVWLRQSDACFIVATGPGIKEQDLSLLQGRDVYSVSNFFLHPLLKLIRPRAHFFAPWHEPMPESNYLDWLSSGDAKLPRETRIFLGESDRQRVSQRGIFLGRRCHYLRLTHEYFPARCLDLSKPLLWPMTGPLMIIPVVLALGYSKVYLVGCDHNALLSFCDRSPIRNFYPPELDMRIGATSSACWEGMNLVNQLEADIKLHKQYFYYRWLIESHYPMVEILNLSPTSWLDQFPRADFWRAVVGEI
jgi:hypothetical protein